MKLTVLCLTHRVIGSGIPEGKKVYRVSTEQGEVIGYYQTRAEARREAGLDERPDTN